MPDFQCLSIRDFKDHVCTDMRVLFSMPKVHEYVHNVSLKETVIITKGMWLALPQEFRPIPWRQTIVVTKDREFVAVGALKAASVFEAVSMVKTKSAYFVGGLRFLKKALPYCSAVYEVVTGSVFPTRRKALSLDYSDWSQNPACAGVYNGAPYTAYVRNRRNMPVRKKG